MLQLVIRDAKFQVASAMPSIRDAKKMIRDAIFEIWHPRLEKIASAFSIGSA
jgi:hypothetical protein